MEARRITEVDEKIVMPISAHSYAVQLETIFKRKYSGCDVCADTFERCPQEALETGLTYLMNAGVLRNEDFLIILSEYDFGDGNLLSFLGRSDGRVQLEELIRRLNCLGKEE